MVQIITDSTTDIPAEEMDGLDLQVLPLTITVDNTNYLDGVDISIVEVYDFMRNDILPITAQIPYEEMHQAFEACCRQKTDFLYISFSSEMSGCFSLAHVVTAELQEQYPNCSMKIIDSRGGSAATGLIVLQALKMAKEGAKLDEIVSEIQFMIAHVEHIFSIADLKWMVKGGRIAAPIGYVGSILNIRPWLDVEDGKMIVKGMVRGQKKALATVAREVIKRTEKFPDQLIAITHADDIAAAKKVEEQILAGLPKCKTVICEIGGVLGVHLGMGGVGVFFMNEKSPNYML